MRITCDLDEEKAKALAHDGSVLVTANPGTGKTHLLNVWLRNPSGSADG